MKYDFSKIKGLLFDKDGTLFDFDKTWNTIANLCSNSEISDQTKVQSIAQDVLRKSIDLFRRLRMPSID